ncbi:PstA family ABC transporter permease [Catenulispora subtropica]|uniref:Phosphate ABC transporter permease PstA n=1 Tax=Catenulispora subtropica TaxID=450798 RepID=A0ABP5BSE2_9ACTN
MSAAPSTVVTAPATTATAPATTATAPAATPAATTVVAPVEPALAATPEPRRRVHAILREDVFALVGSLIAAVATTAVIFVWLAPFDNPVGFVLCAYVLFLLIYRITLSQDHDRPAVRDRMVAAVVASLALVLLGTMAHVVGFALVNGRRALPHWNFYSQDIHLTAPQDPLTKGGIEHAVVGTLIEISIALAITVPLGVLTAVMLNEIPGRVSRLVRTITEAATALPSIVAGLFIYATLLVPFGHRTSGVLHPGGLAAAIAISVMMLPIIIRASDVVLRLTPGSLKEASYALGAGQWSTVWRVTLPTARSGLTTAVILGTARGLGETSPVLLCAGLARNTNWDPTHDPMTSLPLFVFNAVRSPEPGMIARGYGAAAVLLVIVLVLFTTARLLARRNRSLTS